MGFFSSSKKKDGEKAPDANGPPTATPYFGPFPLTGDTVEDTNRFYTTASKTDSFMFRNLADETDGYTLRYDKEGVYVWDRKISGEPMNMIKMFSTFECPPEVMWDMLHDPVYRVVWDEARIDTYRIALLNPTNDIGYYAGKSPTGVANRDFLNQRAWHNAGNGEYIIFNTSVHHFKCPEVKGTVRAISKLSGYLIRKWGDNGCSLTYLTQTDPKGWIPSSMVNYITTKFGPQMMGKMRKASSGYIQWRDQQGDKHQKDWDVPQDPWDTAVDDKTSTYVQGRMGAGDSATPIVPSTPVSDTPSQSPSSPSS